MRPRWEVHIREQRFRFETTDKPGELFAGIINPDELTLLSGFYIQLSTPEGL